MKRVEVRMARDFPYVVVRTPETGRALRDVGERVAARARQILASIDPDEPIEVELDEDSRGKVARVVNRDWKGHFLEGGTIRQPARPHLRPALEAEGLRPAPADGGAGTDA